MQILPHDQLKPARSDTPCLGTIIVAVQCISKRFAYEIGTSSAMQCSHCLKRQQRTCWEDALVDDGDVNVVALQPLEEATGRVHAADARCNVQQRQHCARILQTETQS